MTNERMALLDLVEKDADSDLVRDMLAFAAERMMEAEAEGAAGAAKGARTPLRDAHRNGYRAREWDTRAGRIELAIPRLRKGSYFPSFLEPRRTAEKALVAMIQEAYVHGVSTRAVDDLVRAMGASGVSNSQVSRLCAAVVHDAALAAHSWMVSAAGWRWRWSMAMGARRSRAGWRARYRVQDWAAYDRALARRGDITVWVSPDAVAGWRAPAGRRTFSDAAITAALT